MVMVDAFEIMVIMAAGAVIFNIFRLMHNYVFTNDVNDGKEN